MAKTTSTTIWNPRDGLHVLRCLDPAMRDPRRWQKNAKQVMTSSWFSQRRHIIAADEILGGTGRRTAAPRRRSSTAR